MSERLELLKIGDICQNIEIENRFIEKIQKMEENKKKAFEDG